MVLKFRSLNNLALFSRVNPFIVISNTHCLYSQLLKYVHVCFITIYISAVVNWKWKGQLWICVLLKLRIEKEYSYFSTSNTADVKCSAMLSRLLINSQLTSAPSPAPPRDADSPLRILTCVGLKAYAPAATPDWAPAGQTHEKISNCNLTDVLGRRDAREGEGKAILEQSG